eukprot:11844112-Karenia_brevis.AAC.1
MIALLCHQQRELWLKVRNDVLDVSGGTHTSERVVNHVDIFDLPVVATTLDLYWNPTFLIQL